MKLRVIEFLAVMFAALGEFIHIGKTIMANVAIPMSVIIPVTLLLMLAAAWVSRGVNRASFYLYTTSFLWMLITLIITVAVEVPIDNKIKTWTAAAIPANWNSLRHTWDQFHTIRTLTSIASVAFFAWGLVKRTIQ